MERGKKMARKFRVVVNGREYIVEVEEMKEGPAKTRPVVERIETTLEEKPKVEAPKVEKKVEMERPSGGGKEVKAPMAGIVVKILVSPGQRVNVGDKLLIFESMKMENELVSDVSGTVKEVRVKEGDNFETGQVLVVIE